MVRALSHVLFFNPGPVRRVPIPNRYTAKAELCFCKNNKRRIIMCLCREACISRRCQEDAERKTSRLGVGLLRGASPPPRSPRASSTSPSSNTAVAAMLKKMPLMIDGLCSGSLFFLSAIALVNFLGVASPHRAFPVLVLVPRFVGNRYCVPYA
jgi:hypothetical protein